MLCSRLHYNLRFLLRRNIDFTTCEVNTVEKYQLLPDLAKVHTLFTQVDVQKLV